MDDSHIEKVLCAHSDYFPHVCERLLKREAKRKRTYFHFGCVLAGDSSIGQMQHSSGVQ